MTTTYTNTQIAAMTCKQAAEAFGILSGKGHHLVVKAKAAIADGKASDVFMLNSRTAKGEVKSPATVKTGKSASLQASGLSADIQRGVSCAIMMLQLGDMSQTSIKAAFEGNDSGKLESMLGNVMTTQDIASAKNWAGVMTLADKCLALITTNIINAKVQEEAYLTLLNAGWEIDRQIGNAETCKAERYLPLLKGVANRGDVETLDEVRQQLASGIMPLIITGQRVVLDDFAMDTSRRFHYAPVAPTKPAKATKVAKAA